MQAFSYDRPATLAQALSAAAEPEAQVIAGGTELLNWMKDGIAAPRRLVDLNALPGLDGVTADESGLTIGALARMSDIAAHPAVQRDFPVLSQALLKSASQQIRNMASLGGNLLQRTRCPYFRAEVELPCNKRRPGSGCAALEGADRAAAVFGWSEHCIATHPSDAAVALAALDATVRLQGPAGSRSVPLAGFYRLPGDRPAEETVLEAGELITAVEVPASGVAARSSYVKVRERASFEFALVSAAVGVELDGATIRTVRVALGGVAALPWRLRAAEQALVGISVRDGAALGRALEADFAAARPRRENGFKIELAKRAVVAALVNAGERA